MSYEHKRVSALNPRMSRDEAGNFCIHGNACADASYPYWIDGLPVVKKLYDFATELRKQCPNYKFGAVNYHHSTNIALGTASRAFFRIAVYVDTCEYVLGQIGYGDFYLSDDTNTCTYMVYSRTIKNKKIHNFREQHSMLLSVDMVRGVKNAAKSLRIYPLREIANLSADDFGTNLRSARNDTVQEAHKFVSRITSNVMMTELRHLIRSGVGFVTPEFKDAAANFMAADEEAQKAKNTKYGGYFVVFTKTGPNRDVLQASVLTYAKGLEEHCNPTPESETVMPAADLPDDIQAKIAVLSMSAGSFVPGVGMSVSDTSYWIERATT
jgi:hypothetical protein